MIFQEQEWSKDFVLNKYILTEYPTNRALLKKTYFRKKEEDSYTIIGNVNCHSHYGEQYGGSLKK